jgi:hypothetical protein
MTQSNFDTEGNPVPAIKGTSEVDNRSTVNIWVDPITHELLVKGAFSVTGGATEDNQTNGDQKTQIVDVGGEAVTVTGGKLDVNASIDTTGLATETTLSTRLSESNFDTKIGSLTETAPGTDTASSGLNGRLQRIAQRLTSLITALGTPFQAGGSIGNTSFGATQVTASNLNAQVVGVVAEDAVLSGNPVRQGIRASAAEPTSMSADGDVVTPWGDLKGRMMVAQKAATATLSNVSASATSVTLLSANTARIGATITNDSSALIYIKFGTTASTTSYTVVLSGAASAPFSYYEVPAGYTGRIDGIWASATGNARVTEIT